MGPKKLQKRNMMARVLMLTCCLSLLAATTMADTDFFVTVQLAGHGVPEGASFTLQVRPSWAPLGAARFRQLVEAKFYDDTRFFRVLDGDYDIWIAQFGLTGC